MFYAAGTPTWVAGTRLNFYVQLRDASSINVSTSLLTNLTVRCVADPSAPPNASFCLDGPWISPVGLGCYHVVLRVGTIWWVVCGSWAFQRFAGTMDGNGMSINDQFGTICRFSTGSPGVHQVVCLLSEDQCHYYIHRLLKPCGL